MTPWTVVQTHVHWVSDAIQPFHPPSPLLLLPSIFPSISVCSNESAHCSRWSDIGVSASASVLPMNTEGWLPSGLTGWFCLQSKGLSRVFSSTTIQKHEFFSAQPSSRPHSHICKRDFRRNHGWEAARNWTLSSSCCPFAIGRATHGTIFARQRSLSRPSVLMTGGHQSCANWILDNCRTASPRWPEALQRCTNGSQSWRLW